MKAKDSEPGTRQPAPHSPPSSVPSGTERRRLKPCASLPGDHPGPTKEDRAGKNHSLLLGESPLVNLSILGESRSNQISGWGLPTAGIYRLLRCCYTSILINPDTAWKRRRGRGEVGALQEQGQTSLSVPGFQIGESVPTGTIGLPQAQSLPFSAGVRLTLYTGSPHQVSWGRVGN